MGSLKAYNTAGKHRHNPEIIQNLKVLNNFRIMAVLTSRVVCLQRAHRL